MPKTTKRAVTKRAEKIAKAHASELIVRDAPKQRRPPGYKPPARGLARYAGRNRKLSAWANAVGTTAAHFRRVLGQLWLEVTGFVFLSLAAIGAAALVREYTRLHAGNSSSGRVAVAICFTMMFGWFGVSSFWRVRKRS